MARCTHIQGVGLPFSVKPLWELPQRLSEVCLLGDSNLAKLMVKVNHPLVLQGTKSLELFGVVHGPTWGWSISPQETVAFMNPSGNILGSIVCGMVRS